MRNKASVMYFLFAIITSLVGFNWFMWGPILGPIVETQYRVSGFVVTLFISAVPLMLVLLSYFAGNLADIDPKRTTIISAAILGITSLIKPFFSFNFFALLLVHLVFTLSAAFCFTSWAPLTYRLFESEKSSSRVALFTAFLTAGQILAFLITYPMVSRTSLFTTLLIYGLVTFFICVIYILIAIKVRFPYSVEITKRPTLLEGAKIIFSEHSIKPLAIICFLDIGVFSWLAGWYPKMLTRFKGINPSRAGIVNAMILVGCLIGAMIIPNLSHKLKKVKVFLLVLPVICILMFVLIPPLSSYGILLIDGVILGFALFPMYPLGVHLPSAFNKIGMKYAGVGSGIILIAANLGGFILPELGVLSEGLTSSIIMFGILPMAFMFVSALFFKDPY